MWSADPWLDGQIVGQDGCHRPNSPDEGWKVPSHKSSSTDLQLTWIGALLSALITAICFIWFTLPGVSDGYDIYPENGIQLLVYWRWISIPKLQSFFGLFAYLWQRTRRRNSFLPSWLDSQSALGSITSIGSILSSLISILWAYTNLCSRHTHRGRDCQHKSSLPWLTTCGNSEIAYKWYPYCHNPISRPYQMSPEHDGCEMSF